MSLYDKASIALIPSGYKASTLYSVMPANGNGDFDHIRSNTTATRLNKDGLIEDVTSNIPRLDYPLTNGLVGDCPHLLLEPSRTNEFIRSEEFDNSTWVKTRTTVQANQVIAPDGTLTADELREDTQNGAHYFYDIDFNSDAETTFSIFAKYKGNGRGIAMSWASATTYFDLENGVIESSANDSAEIIAYPNGWYRCIITDDPTSQQDPVFYIYKDNGDVTYQGDGTSGIYVWGAQAEFASYATSYIPTTSTVITRSGDACFGSGTSADINSEEGVLFVEMATFDQNDTSDRRIAISSGNTNYVIRLTYAVAANRLYAVIYSLGTVWATYTTLSNAEDFNKVALKYKASDFDFYVNGVKVQQQSSGATFPANTMTEVAFDNGGGGNDFYGKIKQLIVFNEALSDSELETLTS